MRAGQLDEGVADAGEGVVLVARIIGGGDGRVVRAALG